MSIPIWMKIDHASLQLQRWAIILMTYTYELQFKSTANHDNTDGLSRLPLKETNVTDDFRISISCSQDCICYVNNIASCNISNKKLKDRSTRTKFLTRPFGGWKESGQFLVNKQSNHFGFIVKKYHLKMALILEGKSY